MTSIDDMLCRMNVAIVRWLNTPVEFNRQKVDEAEDSIRDAFRDHGIACGSHAHSKLTELSAELEVLKQEVKEYHCYISALEAKLRRAEKFSKLWKLSAKGSFRWWCLWVNEGFPQQRKLEIELKEQKTKVGDLERAMDCIIDRMVMFNSSASLDEKDLTDALRREEALTETVEQLTSEVARLNKELTTAQRDRDIFEEQYFEIKEKHSQIDRYGEKNPRNGNWSCGYRRG